ncbi:MAG: 2-phospho-L-lactate guanylyltransferase [Terriglobales bacterium]
MILIPVKNLSHAKQRLAPLLDQRARTELAQAMLTDVLDAVCSVPNRPPVSVVTNDSFALGLARDFDCEVISDIGAQNETEAIEMATRSCEERGIAFTLVIPADIPLVTAAELELVLRSAPKEGSVLVPSSDKRGTNAAYRSPCGLFPLRFGDDSFKPHLAAAEATGKPCVVLPLNAIGLDVDTSADLQRLCVTPGQTRSQLLARRWNLSTLSLATNESAR